MNEQNLILPDDVTKIAEGAFMNNKNLKHADLRNVRYIGARAFQDCAQLESVVMSKATVIGPMAFELCRSLRSITTGDIEEVGEAAFSHCDKLDIQVFPESLRKLGAYAFSHTATKRADLHWLEEIPKALFADCLSLEFADVSGAKVIGESAFAGCESLERVKFDSAEQIGAKAFLRCYSFVPAKLPESLCTIGDDAFGAVRSGIIVPKSVRQIGHNCFGPVDRRKSVQIYESCLYEFRNYFRDDRQSEFEDEHFYMHESATDVTILDDATGEMTGFLPLYSDLDYHLRTSVYGAFREDNSFDYSYLDNEMFYEMRWNQRCKDRLALLRMKHRYDLSESAEKQYSDYLAKHAARIAERAVRSEDVEMLAFLHERGQIRKEDLGRIIDLAISLSAYDCTAFLLKCQSELSGYDNSEFDEL